MERSRHTGQCSTNDATGGNSDLREEANAELYGGWPMILSGLKTLLETGERLTTPGSPCYAEGGESAGGG